MAGATAPAAQATTTCTFTTAAKLMRLDADCTTDATIFIPDGFTLDGQGHTITAVDPPGGAFPAAILKNAGAVAHVRNATLTASGIGRPSGGERLLGIHFEGASGSIVDNRIIDVTSGCFPQEPNILLRKAPFDGTRLASASVIVRDNLITVFWQGGVSIIGDVRATVTANTLEGLSGAVTPIGQIVIAIQGGALVMILPGFEGDVGIQLRAVEAAVADGNAIKGNTIEGFASPIVRDGDTNTIVQGNTVHP